jgi:hydroxyacylglutathione hydrolase
MQLERLALGPMANFVYLLIPQAQDRLAVVDPAWQPDVLLARAAALGRPITDIILTHHHADHRNGVEALLAEHPARIHVQRAEWPWLAEQGWRSDAVLHDPGDRLDLGGGDVLRLIHTPGHTPGSQCIECAGKLLTGDTLFVDGCGRCDLPGGDPVTMFHTLSGILGALPGSTRVFPGHDYAPVPESTLEDQRKSNPYLHFQTVDDFTRYRMRPRT